MAGATIKVPGIGKVPKRYAALGAAGLVGLLGWSWFRGAAGTGGAATSLDPSTGAGPEGAATGAAGGPSFTGGAGESVDTTAADGPPVDNATWTTRAVEYLTSVGVEPGYAAATLGKYLNKSPLTPAEASIVMTARAGVGVPPVGTWPIIPSSTITAPTPKPNTPTPTPTTPKPKPAPNTVKVRAGDTLGKVAKRAGVSLSRLRQLNPNLFDRKHRGGNLIRPGETVRTS